MTLALLFLSLSTCFRTSPACASALPQAPLSLEVRAHGFSGEGTAHVLLYEEGQKLKLNCRTCPQNAIPIRKGQCLVRFEGLKAGNYAVMVYHDENGNGKLDTNALGMPREGVGTSNNHRGIPSFKKCCFDLEQSSRISIEVVYLRAS